MQALYWGINYTHYDHIFKMGLRASHYKKLNIELQTGYNTTIARTTVTKEQKAKD